MAKPTKPTGGPATGPRRAFIVWRLIWSWIQTLASIALVGGLSIGALVFFGLHWTFGLAFFSLWMIMPILGWYHSASLVCSLTASRPANPKNPMHAKFIRVYNRLYPKTGLTVKPPAYVSPLPVPNAFATGRDPAHAFIAVTEGLFLAGLTDDELETVLAHELAHVRNYDVALNSMLAVLGSSFSLLLAQGLPWLFRPALISTGAPLLDRLHRQINREKQRFFLPVGGFLGFVVMTVIFYLVSIFTKLISLFVARLRESAADTQAAFWTGNPCALSTALQKIALYLSFRQMDLRIGIITQGLSPLWFVNTFDEEELDQESGSGLSQHIHQWWRRLGENHPPLKDRIVSLDKMNGSSCPRLF